MTDKQIRDRIVGALSVSMMPMEMEAECVRFLDRCPRWIPVMEGLPESFVSVLVYMPSEKPLPTVHEGYYVAEDECWVVGMYALPGDPVTHWMPMPDAPEYVTDIYVGNKEIEYIRSQLSGAELLAGLAEEATELAHAALKLRRVIDGKNHTPVTYDEAYANLKEEIGDVLLSLEALGLTVDPEAYRKGMDAKLERWVDRLKNRR